MRAPQAVAHDDDPASSSSTWLALAIATGTAHRERQAIWPGSCRVRGTAHRPAPGSRARPPDTLTTPQQPCHPAVKAGDPERAAAAKEEPLTDRHRVQPIETRPPRSGRYACKATLLRAPREERILGGRVRVKNEALQPGAGRHPVTAMAPSAAPVVPLAK